MASTEFLSIHMIIFGILSAANSQIPLNTDILTPSDSLTPNSFKVSLGEESNVNLTWTADRNEGIITFTVESDLMESKYVALALTKQGELQGADVVVVGLNQDGTPYVRDMHGVDNSTIAEDIRQDWRLVGNSTVSENGIRISIQRNLDSCDEQDMEIGSEKITVVYATGEGNISTEFEAEGSKQIYFLDPIILPESSNISAEDFMRWRVSRRYELPARRTSYWCSIIKRSPTLAVKHHITGFNVFFGNEEARHRVHHQILYRCITPIGADADAIFEPYLDFPGEECYVNDRPILPSAYCREMVYAYAIGGEEVLLPESLGLTIGGVQNEYFMFETHYDNPDSAPGIVVENGVDIYHTPELRVNDGSLIFVGYGVLGTFIMPPNLSSFTVGAHCSKACSTQMTPLGGMDIVGVNLHAHTSTLKMKLRHFRGDVELPFVLNDEEYDFQYQQVRILDTPRRILQGDQLTVECVYDNTWRNGSATVSGFDTSNQMCMAFLFVTKEIPYLFCSSEYDTNRTMERFGIRDMRWNTHSQERIITAADDPAIVGLTLSQVVERQNWTETSLQQLEREQLYSNHAANCPNTRIFGGVNYYSQQLENATGGLVQFPQLDEGSPTTTSIRTPFPSFIPVRYPIGPTYNELDACPSDNSSTGASVVTESSVGLNDAKSLLSAPSVYQNIVTVKPVP